MSTVKPDPRKKNGNRDDEKEEERRRNERIDEGSDESFPASDPPATSQPGSEKE